MLHNQPSPLSSLVKVRSIILLQLGLLGRCNIALWIHPSAIGQSYRGLGQSRPCQCLPLELSMDQSPSGFGNHIVARVVAKSWLLTNEGVWESFLQIWYLTNRCGVALDLSRHHVLWGLMSPRCVVSIPPPGSICWEMASCDFDGPKAKSICAYLSF